MAGAPMMQSGMSHDEAKAKVDAMPGMNDEMKAKAILLMMKGAPTSHAVASARNPGSLLPPSGKPKAAKPFTKKGG